MFTQVLIASANLKDYSVDLLMTFFSLHQTRLKNKAENSVFKLRLLENVLIYSSGTPIQLMEV